MGWHARLELTHLLRDGKTVSHSRHQGPLRVLADLYPEGPSICHQVLVHPPGGLVSGDVLDLGVDLGPGTHALLTTPGATRFYRSSGEPARQQVRARVASGARLEWLPLETICHRATRAENRLRFELATGADMIGWDILALGLPASRETFDAGSLLQEIEIPGSWLDRARLDASDRRLLDSPLGWNGRHVLGTLWFARGEAVAPSLRESLLDAAREAAAASTLADSCGASAVNDRLIVVRVLAHRVEPAMALLGAIRAAWRVSAWQLQGAAPRIWRT
jgi:urease accessory protein